MNKKGFTLVEILAVIVVLSLIITVVATNGFGVFDIAKERISKENEKAIIEGARILLVEIENCENFNDSTLDSLLGQTGVCKNINTNKKICKLLNGNTCTSDFLNNNGFTSSNCSNIECDNSKICFDVKLDDLIKKEYVIGSGVEEVLNKDPNYSTKICLNGDIIVN